MNTGKLPHTDCEVTPVAQNDAPIRQYLINNPIDNPDDNEILPSLLPSNQIFNTTVDRSKCSNKKNGLV